ncbi:hypothetical protein HFN65_31415 [Rhizobium laguerreae]|uniref:hypothetical protein n=1 Tax=Rhizobium laguerreae TaxID=1076926 RepID=UPI001C90DA6A|nr:hypothetical protein [Rhizobium laguerreae]MBY3575449.1 hypothetical protein [Rhizobium laguerreae]
MTTAMTANSYQPKNRYYDQAAERIRAKMAELQKAGPSAWLAGEAREAHLARVAAEAKAAATGREYLAPQTVGNKVEKYMEAVGRKAYMEVTKALPRHLKMNAVEPNGQSLVKHPHLGFTKFGTFDVTNRDGSVTTFNLFAANFRADPIQKDGLQMFDRIPKQIDGVKNEAMLYAHAINKATGLPDHRFGSPDLPGVAFRLGDIKKVADACARLAGPAPEQRNAMSMQPSAPRPSLQRRGMAYA